MVEVEHQNGHLESWSPRTASAAWWRIGRTGHLELQILARPWRDSRTPEWALGIVGAQNGLGEAADHQECAFATVEAQSSLGGGTPGRAFAGVGAQNGLGGAAAHQNARLELQKARTALAR